MSTRVARWMALGMLLASLGLVGCPAALKDAIALSEKSHDFGSSRESWNLQVWNSSSSIASLNLKLSTKDAWIHFDPATATSTAASDIKVFTVTVSRVGLAAGTYSGSIKITASGAKSKTIPISMLSDGTEGVPGNDLNIVGMTQSFTAPYLLDFCFSLRDKTGRPVIGEPSQFHLTCMEAGLPISPEENAPFFAKASQKQPLCFLVLDYSASMASIQLYGDSNHDGKSDAIDAMETAVKTQFLPALSGPTLVGVYEFHRETDPEQVVGLSADKEFVSRQIDRIWPDFVASFWGASRPWDAVLAALDQFGQEDANDENRNVVLISDGRNSSQQPKEKVISSARDHGARVYAIGFGANVDGGALQSVTFQTNGQYYAAQTAQDLGDRFLKIVEDLDGQYALRWATLARTDTTFVPSFQLALQQTAVAYTSPAAFKVSLYGGDELTGPLRLVPSVSDSKTTFFLRAGYMPRNIWALRFYLQSPDAFSVRKVETGDGGLCGGWNLSVTGDATRSGVWVSLDSPDPGNIETPIPFAAFGPILQIDFDQVFDEGVIPFEFVYVDNTLYHTGQGFTIEGWNNVLP